MIASDDPIKKYEPLWGNWKVLGLLGEGSYGRVYRVARKDGGSYESAVKLISIPRNEADIHNARQMGVSQDSMYSFFADTAARIVKEISIMHALKGEANIVSYEDHQIFHEEGTLRWDILIRMELLVPLDVYVANNQFSSDEIRRLGVEICSALEACSVYGVIHRDIKEANIFLNSRGTFKLGDFGIAREVSGSGSMSMSMRGTPAYIAPEVYNGCKYDARADIYSLGILMYKMLNAGRYPFLPPAPAPITLDDTENAFARRIKGEIPPQPLHGDSALRAAVLRAICFDPHARFQSASDFKTALQCVSSAPIKNAEYKKPATILSPLSTQTLPVVPLRKSQETMYKPYEGKAAIQPDAKQQPKRTKTPIYIAVASLLIIVIALVIVLIKPGASMLPINMDMPSQAASMPSESVTIPVTSDSIDVDADAIVEWTDPVMKQLLCGALGKNEEDVCYGDLAGLEELYIKGDMATLFADEFEAWSRTFSAGGVESFEDLRYCTSLTTLYIYDQQQTGLEPLANLTKLKNLALVNCNRPDMFSFDISPLSGLTGLTKLDITDDFVEDISALKSLVNLTSLDISGLFAVEDISIVSGMTQLQTLNAVHTGVRKIPDLSKLSSLTYLNFQNSKIEDVTGLEGNPSLQEINLTDNYITYLWGVKDLPQLQELYLNGNKINDISELAGLDSVTWLELMENHLTDASALLEMDSLQYLYIDRGDSDVQATLDILKNEGVSVSYF